jgi:hypothetical protein
MPQIQLTAALRCHETRPARLVLPLAPRFDAAIEICVLRLTHNRLMDSYDLLVW